MTSFALMCHGSSHNLGDEIQSIAARRWLPDARRMIDREALDRDPGGRAAMILNGWFMADPERWPPHPDIAPLIVSLHLDQDRALGWWNRWRATPAQRLLRRDGGYLAAQGPVGARDPATLALLRAHGIPAYLSGCLTLTLDREAERGDAIVACDLEPEAVAALEARVGKVMVTTHHTATVGDVGARFAEAERLLGVYARARAVATTRLHCALPCLAMGTPVLFMTRWPDHYRLQPAMALARSCTTEDFLAQRDGYDFDAPPENPRDYLPLREGLIRSCDDWLLRMR